ncbi:[LSU ribosomal protein L11P]-lysine N-methyltransferase [Caloramator quimbayensis]|uniref:Ribosomal protein L11 methyltransferase n=1 Tax=Caloramator quimbayensis TaxID=1147123 RepID=A0A1T4X8F0_9CLOT|nr:50S ribosomal protein L11 methyltransferase [Caloramator quimbayensis]SKA85856.1 [LSU ribosomal protein L11P]-lysine N-methyltransferase [Caloramator quimbayensis]
MKGKWIEVKLITSSAAVEPISGIFYGLDVKGVAIEDPNDIINRNQGEMSWDFADVSILEYKDSAAVVKGYFSQDDDIDKIVEYINNKIKELIDMGIDVGEGKIVTNVVFEEDWANSWKKYYRTTKIGKNIVIKPKWEEYSPKDDEIIIELDPGMAFGTGTHETTIMCIELLEKYIKEGDTVFDIGTGSGILSIASSKLKAGKVIGVDIDEVAVDAARENIQYNNVSNVKIRLGNLTDVVEGKADVIVANIIADIILKLADTIKPFLKEGGIFIVSGIIQDRKQDIIEKFNKSNFNICDIKQMGEWVAISAKVN